MADSIFCGLIGSGIQGSHTPRLHEQEAAAHGLHCVYKKFDLDELKVGVEALPELLADAERLGYAGLNITYPCKQAILPLLHELSADARAIGAVNTVLLKHGRRIGYNTDSTGFAASAVDLAGSTSKIVSCSMPSSTIAARATAAPAPPAPS